MKHWQVVFDNGRKRREFFSLAVAEAFAAEVGSVVEPVGPKGFRLRTIERVDGKPVQVIK